MPLKEVAFGPPKQGKTVHGLTMSELGNIGVVDTEDRWQWYTEPHATVAPGPFPFDNPRQVRKDLALMQRSPTIRAALTHDHVIYLVTTMDVNMGGAAIEGFNEERVKRGLVGIVVDSDSIFWDMAQDIHAEMVNELPEDMQDKMSMLKWGPVKRLLRRFNQAAQSGHLHVLLTAWAKDIYAKVPKRDGGEGLKVVGVGPWLEKNTPHWADIVTEFSMGDADKYPTLVVKGEGTGGMGGLVKGAKMADPTFAKLVEKLGGAKIIAPARESAEEAERNTRRAIERVARSAPVRGVDDRDPPKRGTLGDPK